MKDQSKTKQTLIQKRVHLNEASEYAENIINTVREPLIVLDQDLRVVTASRSFYEFFKVKPEETEGQLIYNLGNEQWDIPKLRELLETVLPEKTTFDNYEVEHDFATIGKRIMLLNARQIKRALGKERIILLAIEDITERKRLENLLTDSEERYRHLFETASDGIVFLEQREGKITHANPASEKMLGYTKKELIGNKLQDIGVLLDLGDFQTTMQHLNKNGIFHYNDVPVKTKSGQHIDTDIYLVDRATLVQCSIRDVTERIHAEEDLREREERYREFFSTSRDCVFITSMEGKWIDFNDTALEMFGYDSREELFQVFISSLYINREERSLFLALIEKQGYVKEHPVRLKRKDGAVIDALITSGFRRNANGFEKEYYGTIRDITEQKRAEKALRESEERYRLIAENTADTIAIFDLNLNSTYISPSILKLRGYSVQEAMALTLNQMLTPDSLQQASKMFADQMALESSGTADPARTALIDLEEYCKDGSTIWVELATSFLRDNNLKPTGILTITRNITERRRVEDALRQSNEQYRLLADNIHDVIFVLDMNLHYTYVSPSVKVLWGYEPLEVVKQQAFETLTPSSIDLAVRTLSEVMELEKSEHRDINISRTLQLEMIRKDGTTVWGEVRFSFLRNENQQAVGILGVTRDITERKRADEALRDSEEQYRLVVENAKESIIIVQDVKVVFVNSAAIGMIGYSKEILTSKSFTDFIHPDDLNMVVDHHIRRIKGEEVPPVYSFRVIGQDGTVIWCELNAAVIQWKGKPATLNFLNNITERRKSEEELKQTLESLRKSIGATIQTMVSAVEMRDPYTAGHQIRTADLARAIATEMGLPKDKIDGIRMAGSIHDIGKLSIPAEILSKPTKLTDIEFSLIKEHSRSGYEMLKDVESPWPLAQIVYQHHERMDGSGYPRNLKGEEILIEARIMAVADVVEAIASHRPYRPGLGIEVALEEIEKNKGIFYDDAVADACLRLFREKGYQLK